MITLVRITVIIGLVLVMGGTVFLSGALWEHCRRGGTADLQKFVDTVVPMRARRRRDGWGRGVSR